MKRILVVFLTSLVLFTGCKYNDDNLWDEVKKQAERITALGAKRIIFNRILYECNI